MTIRMIHPLLGTLDTKQGCLETLCTTYVRKISRTYGICMCDSHTYGTYENVGAMYAMYATSPAMYAVVFFADVRREEGQGNRGTIYIFSSSSRYHKRQAYPKSLKS